MIVTLTANACLDHTVYAPSFSSATETPIRECRQAGGKGVNVARILHALGETVHSIVIVGGDTGAQILADLQQSEIQHTAVYSPGNSRTYLERIALGRKADVSLDTEQPSHPLGASPRHPFATRPCATHQFSGGLEANGAVASTLFDVIDSLLPHTRWFAVCGSLAPGLPENLIAKIIARCREKRVFCAVDSHGPALTQAWRAGPDLLRINREEAAEALCCAPHEISIARCFALGHATRGVISDGENPFLAWGGILKPFRVTPPLANTQNPTGCGDAMLAGLLLQLANLPYCRDSSATSASTQNCAGDDPIRDREEMLTKNASHPASCNAQKTPPTPNSFTRALRFATALAAAEAEAPYAGHPNLARAEELQTHVHIRAWPKQ